MTSYKKIPVNAFRVVSWPFSVAVSWTFSISYKRGQGHHYRGRKKSFPFKKVHFSYEWLEGTLNKNAIGASAFIKYKNKQKSIEYNVVVVSSI